MIPCRVALRIRFVTTAVILDPHRMAAMHAIILMMVRYLRTHHIQLTVSDRYSAPGNSGSIPKKFTLSAPVVSGAAGSAVSVCRVFLLSGQYICQMALSVFLEGGFGNVE